MSKTHVSLVLAGAILLNIAASFAQNATPLTEAKLIAVLKSDAPQKDKADACRELARIGTREAVPVLAALLSDEKLSHMARYGLEPIPDASVDAALRDALGKVKGKLLQGVIASIGVRRDAGAVPALAPLLSDADANVASAAAVSLGKIGTQGAADTLKKALGGASPAVLPALCEGCLQCADTLLSQNNREAATALYDAVGATQAARHIRMAAMRGSILARGNAGTPMLIAQLKGADAGMCAVAMRLAHEVPGTELTQALAAELPTLPAERQVSLIGVLGDRRDAAGAKALLATAKSGTTEIRVASIRAMTQIGSDLVVPMLLELVADAQADVAAAARFALASFPGSQADAAIVSLLSQPDAKTRGLAIDLLGQRRIPGALPAILKAASDADESVRLASLKVLGDQAGVPELPALVDLLLKASSPAQAQAAESALSALCARQSDADACAEKIVAVLPQAKGAAKVALVKVLRAAPGGKALATVRAAASDADADVKAAALRVLCEWPTPEAIGDLANLAKTSDDPRIKILALRGYVRLIPRQNIPAENKLASLKEVMAGFSRADEKKLVLGAVGEIYTADALAFAMSHAEEAALKDEACMAAISIAEKIYESAPDKAASAMRQVAKVSSNADVTRRARALLNKMKRAAKAS